MWYFGLILFFVFTYLIASIPFGLVLSKIFSKTDIRNHGSKNIGATNVTRVLGKKLGFCTLMLDALKGIIMIILAKLILSPSPFILERVLILTALIAVIGHIFPIYLKFKGGKGVATTIAVILAINPLLGLCCIIIWIAIFLLTRISAIASISSILAVTLFTIYDYTNPEQILLLTTLSILILARHKENITRLKNGKENRI